jgi:hypothetical protein
VLTAQSRLFVRMVLANAGVETANLIRSVGGHRGGKYNGSFDV